MTLSAEREMDNASVTVPFAGETVVLDGRGVAWLPAHGVLAVSDLHLEKASSLARGRRPLPLLDTRDTLLRLEACIHDYAPDTVICLGDSFHDSAAAARMDAQDAAHLHRLCGIPRRWIWITGNHDPDAPDGFCGEVATRTQIGGIMLQHRPETPQNAAQMHQISGHFHPKAALRARRQVISGPCFAVGARLIIMPAFGAFTGGLNCRDAAICGLFGADNPQQYLLYREKVWRVA